MLTAFVSKTLGRMLLPGLEQDLARAIGPGLVSSAKMTDCFLAPEVYGYEARSPRSSHYCTGTSSNRPFVTIIGHKNTKRPFFSDHHFPNQLGLQQQHQQQQGIHSDTSNDPDKHDEYCVEKVYYDVPARGLFR